MRKIILIDNDEAIRDVYGVLLKRAGFSVNVYSSGEPILLGQFEEPDLFIIDKQLKGMDGLDLCRYLKKRPASAATPVIIFSASNRVAQSAIDAGANEFFEKPFHSKKLIEHINILIGKQSTNSN